jgi:RNA polymerase sigma factor (sigma-70 family)
MPQASHDTSTPEQAGHQAHLEGLLRQAGAGDKQALNQLLLALLPRLRDQVRGSLNTACRDAQSDVLNSVIRRVLERQEPSAPLPLPDTLPWFLGWVGKIICNRCNDEWRRLLKQPTGLDREIPALDGEEQNRRAVLVWGALQLLPNHHRQVLEYTYYDRLSSKEIGTRLGGLSEEAVRVLRFRARENIMELLEDRHDD